ncbi:MAG: hypothetical protein IKF51_00925, partial [Solobacterium sp.]|nr:hypothetical protein [Solobacterium sp.]
MNKVRDNRLKKQDTIYIIVFIMIVALQVWKSHIGPGYTDEHFYLAVADRVAKGDAMLYDIWDIGQLMVFFTFPLVKLFRFVTGGTEEIVLASRLVYVLFTMGIGTGIYLKFRKDSHWSVLSAAIFMLYTPFNIMALSYNTLAIGFTILGLLFYPRNHMRAFNLYMCGVFMASAVLNSPYYILMYLFLSVVMVFNRRIVPVRSWFWISAGAFSLAGVFMVFVLSHAPLAGIIANLPNLVDPQHSTNSLVVFAENGGRLILAYRWFMIAFVSELILTLVWRNDGAKKQKLIDYSIIINTIAIIYVTVLRPYYPLTGGFTIILIPFAIIGIEGCILHKQDYYIVSCFIASLILAFC